MTPEQEGQLFSSVGRLEEGQKNLHHRLNALGSQVDDAKDEARRSREAVEGFAAATGSRLLALETKPATTNGVVTNGGTQTQEDRDALLLGRTLQGLPRLGAALVKAWPVLVAMSLVGGKFAYDAYRGAP